MGSIYHSSILKEESVCLFGYVGNHPCIFYISLDGRYRLDLPGYVVCFDEKDHYHEYFRWIGYRPQWESLRRENYKEYYQKFLIKLKERGVVDSAHLVKTDKKEGVMS